MRWLSIPRGFVVSKTLVIGVLLLLMPLSACAPTSSSQNATPGATAPQQNATQPALGSNIADQLRKAQSQDGTFTIEKSDSNGSHGPKIGDGVSTRSPDLLQFTITIPGNGQSGNVEQVIDFSNAMVYSRLGKGGNWGDWYRKAAKIAHYYDLQSPKVLGTAMINGVPTYHIRGTAISGGHTVTLDVWARTDNLRAAQILETFTIQSATAYFLFIASAYNTGATITVPSQSLLIPS
ncbi:MAG TPA: hypothetical protein VFW76_13935 [Ktedonobacterales bacterium]|nr:hypothetical protein [Ktedonobacterales bacterium]